jgi:hypothetical protein
MHCPCAITTHDAEPVLVHMMSHLKFACAVQLPLHDDWHFVSHVAVGGVP